MSLIAIPDILRLRDQFLVLLIDQEGDREVAGLTLDDLIVAKIVRIGRRHIPGYDRQRITIHIKQPDINVVDRSLCGPLHDFGIFELSVNHKGAGPGGICLEQRHLVGDIEAADQIAVDDLLVRVTIADILSLAQRWATDINPLCVEPGVLRRFNSSPDISSWEDGVA